MLSVLFALKCVLLHIVLPAVFRTVGSFCYRCVFSNVVVASSQHKKCHILQYTRWPRKSKPPPNNCQNAKSYSGLPIRLDFLGPVPLSRVKLTRRLTLMRSKST